MPNPQGSRSACVRLGGQGRGGSGGGLSFARPRGWVEKDTSFSEMSMDGG